MKPDASRLLSGHDCSSLPSRAASCLGVGAPARVPSPQDVASATAAPSRRSRRAATCATNSCSGPRLPHRVEGSNRGTIRKPPGLSLCIPVHGMNTGHHSLSSVRALPSERDRVSLFSGGATECTGCHVDVHVRTPSDAEHCRACDGRARAHRAKGGGEDLDPHRAPPPGTPATLARLPCGGAHLWSQHQASASSCRRRGCGCSACVSSTA